MPLLCPGGFNTCTTTLDARLRLRKLDSDGMLFIQYAHVDILPCRHRDAIDASPGYFSLTLNNSIKMEATATRRAGLERFTFPSGSKPYFVLDLANDLPASFAGGELTIDPTHGRVTIGGRWGSRFATIIFMTKWFSPLFESSFGPGIYTYQAFACYDLLDGGNQKLSEYGVWTGDM
jgi:Glycosyl hydrolase family 92 N-terminal domain